MADTIRDVIIRLSIKQQESKLKVPDVAPVVAASKKVEETQTKVAETITKVAAVSAEANFKIGDALKQGGEGAFTAARGFAFLFTSTDEGYQQLIANVTAAQGAFDLFKGSFETVKGLSAAYTTALAAQSAAQVTATSTGGAYAVVMYGVSAAQTAVAVTAGVASVAMKALWGPLGVALALVSGLVAAAAIVWNSWSKSQKAAAEAAKPVEDAMRKSANALRAQQALVAQLDMKDQIAQLNEYATASEKLANLPSRRAANKELFQSNTQKTAVQIATGQNDGAQKSLSILESQAGMTQQAAEREKERLGLIREAGKELQNNLDKQKQILETAKQSYESEKARVAGLQESLGKLNKIEQAELKRLGDKVKGGGQLTDREAERVGELGGQVGQDYLKERNRQKGEGKEDLLTPFNNGQKLTGQGSKLQEELDKYKKATDDTAKLTQETLKRAAELKVQEQQQMAEVARLLGEVYAEKSAIENLKLFLESQRREADKKAKGDRR